ncbi:MAG: transketolase [Myxococcota bacterium]|nr:transketolase [Myxococcota bacterium]
MSVNEREQLAVNTIKGLGMDAIQKANSGHPGMVMGMADIATVLWHDFVKYDPNDSHWPDRDRVILSNGHGSMLLYSILHLTGTSLSLADIQNFRQWHSPTAGHPEYGYAPGIETTTGPLGQGFANGVGMAMAERWLEEQFSSELVDHYTYVLCGDGCLMEGITAEAASLAGHLRLSKLVVLYDDNNITIDGETNITFSEGVATRFASYGWHVQTIDGHDRNAIREAIQAAKDHSLPSIICCKTVIGHGSPNKAGSNKTHGSPLGVDEIRATKESLGMDPDAHFVVPSAVYSYFQDKDTHRRELHQAWKDRLEASEHKERFMRFMQSPDLSSVDWPTFPAGEGMATRNASGSVIQALAGAVPNLVGGSADLAGSNKTTIQGSGHWSADSFAGRNIHYGVREHAMAGISNGICLHGGIRPFCATFLVFHDYMRPSVRLAALMQQPVIFVYTHDSIYVGEDGPTHQPIEHIESMRIIPNLWVVRPGDPNETAIAWQIALGRKDGPTALCLTRQKLTTLPSASVQEAAKGGYVYSDFSGEGQRVCLCASGSEVGLVIDAKKALEEQGYAVRVVSMICRELFETQTLEYRSRVLDPEIPTFFVEAGVQRGWIGYFAGKARAVSLDRFGASAPGAVVAEKLGLSVSNIVAQVQTYFA